MGSALLEVDVPEGQVDWQGQDHIARRQSSDWAERTWCADCGSNLYFRMTGDSEFGGKYSIPLGLFDDPNGFVLSSEIYIDHKPDSFAYAGAPGRRQLTRADCVAKFPLLDSDQDRSKP
ncbi:GFA family protein [Paracoccus tegillarcae]|nr:GFA family protein [Paracoccus tegillarcae]